MNHRRRHTDRIERPDPDNIIFGVSIGIIFIVACMIAHGGV